eukprot:s3962_g3.t1
MGGCQSSPNCADPAYQKVAATPSTAAAQPLASDGTGEDLAGSLPIETTLESFVWVEEDMPEVGDDFPAADKPMQHLIHQEKEIFQLGPTQEYDETLSTAESSAEMPWMHFLVLWACCSLASGTLSSQSVFVEILAEAGVFHSVCENFAYECADQISALTSVFGVCQSIAYGFSAPIGLMYDLWGAKKTGTTGALSSAVGLLLACGSVFGAASGHDEISCKLLAPGVLLCDFGSLLFSFSLVGFVWHIPHRQTLLIALISSTYQASAALPMLLQAGIKRLELPLHFMMLAWAAAVFAAALVCSVGLPTQIEFLEQAKHVLGVPLPKPGGTRVPQMISRAVGIVRVHLADHLVSGLALASALVLPALYSSLAAPYGELLFGHKSDGKMLVKINVVGGAVAGLVLAPLAGMLADGFGLEAFTVLLAASALVASVTVGIASWPAQALCTSSAVLFTSCLSIYVWRYMLLYSPPSRFGTVQGIFSTAVIFISTPLSVAGMAAISLRPPGLNEYRISMLACGLMGTVLMAHYVAYSRRYPPPDCPTMLPEDEAMLAKSFGCGNLDEVCEVTRVRRKSILIKKMGSNRSEDLLSLLARTDVHKLMEMMAKRPVEDIAAMMEEEDSVFQQEVEENHLGPEAASVAESSSVAEPQAGVRDRARYLARLVAAADAQAVREYLLTEPLEDIWRVWLDFEKWQAPPERRKMDKDFNNIIPSKDLADILRRRPDLKTFVQSVIVQAVERKIATLRGKQK